MKKSLTDKVIIVIPAFNEAGSIGEVIESIRKNGFENIIVVDDGSFDRTAMIAKKKKVYVLRHLLNRGKGAATQTGMDAAKFIDADILVTMDADGQHYAEDIHKLIKPITLKKADVVLGSRLKANKGMPINKIIMNHVANLIIFFFYGIYVSDSQSGFRAYSRKANQIINTTQDRYEFDSEVLHQIKNAGLKFVEVPIKVRYTAYSKSRYKDIKDFQPQNLFNGIKMFLKMIVRSIFS